MKRILLSAERTARVLGVEVSDLSLLPSLHPYTIEGRAGLFYDPWEIRRILSTTERALARAVLA